MNARPGAVGIGPHNRIGARNLDAGHATGQIAVVSQDREVAVDPAVEFEIDQDLVHRCVPDALADSEGRSMEPVGAGEGSCECIDESETPVVVPMPIDLDLLTGLS